MTLAEHRACFDDTANRLLALSDRLQTDSADDATAQSFRLRQHELRQLSSNVETLRHIPMGTRAVRCADYADSIRNCARFAADHGLTVCAVSLNALANRLDAVRDDIGARLAEERLEAELAGDAARWGRRWRASSRPRLVVM